MLPSKLLSVDHPYLAYDLDMAVTYLGKTVQSRLDERDKKGKPVCTSIEQALRIPPIPKRAKPIDISNLNIGNF